MNSKSTYPSCPWMLNLWTTSSLVTALGRNQANPQSPSTSHSLATDSPDANLHNTNKNHTLVPCPDFLDTGSDDESLELTCSEPIAYLDLCKETQANTELLKILCDIGAPLHTYQTLIQWALKHSMNGYDLITRHGTYGSMIAHLQRTDPPLWSGMTPPLSRKSTRSLPKSHRTYYQRIDISYGFPWTPYMLTQQPLKNYG